MISLTRRRSSSLSKSEAPSSNSNMIYVNQSTLLDGAETAESTASNNEGRVVPSKEYDNSKTLRRDSSLSALAGGQVRLSLIQARSPREIFYSVYKDSSWKLFRGLAISVSAFLAGIFGPKLWMLSIMGGMTWRPIPYQLTMAGDVLLDLNLANEFIPKTDVTFPSRELYFLSLVTPVIIVSTIGAVFPLAFSSLPNNNPLHNVHAGLCSILFANAISEFVTQLFKFYVGRLRPNFYAMCGFDKVTLECTSGEEMEMEARMSFPSGHSSWSFCGMMLLVLFFLSRAGLGRVGPRTSLSTFKLSVFMSFVPLMFSFWCATSRLVDNWHHPSDIIAGSVIGAISAVISYHIWFPYVFSPHAGIPLSVIQNSWVETSERNTADYMMVETAHTFPLVR